MQEQDSAILKKTAQTPYKQLVLAREKSTPLSGPNNLATRRLLDEWGLKYHSLLLARRFLLSLGEMLRGSSA
jgi:hypothetical protein